MTTPRTVKVSKRYQIALPAFARERLNIHSGDRLTVDVQDGMLILLQEPKSYTEHLSGLHREVWEEIDAQEFIAGERDGWRRSSSDRSSND